MKIGKRDFNKFIFSIIKKQHYIALWNMVKYYQDFFNCLLRYLFGTGKYPFTVGIRTPAGVVSPTLYSFVDLLTVNEIFCRLDYKVDNKIKVIVDIGSNIGISALYFLTRNYTSFCYLYEPVPENIMKLEINLKNFRGRYLVRSAAVAERGGKRQFGIEKTGRHGGLDIKTEKYITVDCININEVLGSVLGKEEKIDLLKIDIEGSEIEVIKSISKEYLGRIDKIYFEVDERVVLPKNFSIFEELFNQELYGNTYRLYNKNN